MEGEGEQITIFLMFGGDKHELKVKEDEPVENLRAEVAKLTDVAPEEQELKFAGRILEDGKTIDEFYVEDDGTIELTKKEAGGGGGGGGDDVIDLSQIQTTDPEAPNFKAPLLKGFKCVDPEHDTATQEALPFDYMKDAKFEDDDAEEAKVE